MVKIYYCETSEISLNNENIESLPSLRKDYVNGFKNEKRKKQSFFVWKLLEYVLKNFYGIKSLCVSHDNSGVWNIDNFDEKFSLAHSDDIVAVAIAKKSVGVDVEKCAEKILKLKNKLGSFETRESEIEGLTLEWTKKESYFKARVGNNYFYKKIFDADNNAYYLTACSDNKSAEFILVDAKYIK